MNNLRLTLITGRSTRQGTGISTGKDRSDYREATGMVQMNPEDMQHAGLDEGSVITLKSEFGSAEVKCCRADLPSGLAFIAFGPACNQLVGTETCASGIPDSKHLLVELSPAPCSQLPSDDSAASKRNQA